MSKPKLLLISGIAPFPQTSGGATRLLQTLKQLSKRFDIYGYYFTDSESILTDKEQKIVSSYTVSFEPIPQTPKSIFRMFASLIPYHFSNYYNADLIQKIKAIVSLHHFQQIRVESTQLLYLVRFLPKNISSFFVALDVSSISFYRRSVESENILVRLLRLVSCVQVYLYEYLLLPQFQKIAAMSVIDRQYLKSLFKLENVVVSPNGIDSVHFLPQRADKLVSIGFIGSSDHAPNKQAIKFLAEQIMPALQSLIVPSKLLIVGSGNRTLIDSKNQLPIETIEHVANLKEFYEQIDILVAPIFSGSGTRIKVLESLSYGRPVITTEIGAEGIEINSKLLRIIPQNEALNSAIWVSEIVQLIETQTELTSDLKSLEAQLSMQTWEQIFLKD